MGAVLNIRNWSEYMGKNCMSAAEYHTCRLTQKRTTLTVKEKDMSLR